LPLPVTVTPGFVVAKGGPPIAEVSFTLDVLLVGVSSAYEQDIAQFRPSPGV
jgi:hypothetical protein